MGRQTIGLLGCLVLTVAACGGGEGKSTPRVSRAPTVESSVPGGDSQTSSPVSRAPTVESSVPGGDSQTSSPVSPAPTVESGAPDGGAEAYVDALASQATADPSVSASARRCLAVRTVEIVGVDTYKAAGITPEDIRSGLDAADYESLQPAMTDKRMKALQAAWRACMQGRRMEIAWLIQLDAAATPHDKMDMGVNVAADGEQTYVGLSDGVLHALNSSDGTQRWTFDATAAAGPPTEPGTNEIHRFALYPTVSADTVYLGTNTGIVYALDRATGAPRWSYDAATVTGYPVIVDDLVVIGDWTGVDNGLDPSYTGQGPAREATPAQPGTPAQVKALDRESGALRWSTPMPYLSALVAASNDVLVVASADAQFNIDRRSVVTRLDPATGATTWSVAKGGTVRPAIGDTDVYTLEDTTMMSLDAQDGQQRWAVDVGGDQYTGATDGWPVQIEATSKAVAAVIGGDPWWVVAVQPANGQHLWEREGDAEGGFDIATIGSDLIVSPSYVPSYIAELATGSSHAYIEPDQLPTIHTNPVTTRIIARSDDLWIAAAGAWIVGLR
jgi:outer membrane protein assembly factor BamB